MADVMSDCMTDTQGFWFSKCHTPDCKTKPPKPTGKLNKLNYTSNKSTEFGRNSQSTAFIECPLFTEKCNRSNRGSWKHKGTTLKTSVQCAVIHRGEDNKDGGSGSPTVWPVLMVNVGKFLFFGIHFYVIAKKVLK